MIEIMIALLGVMIAVLTLVAGLFAAVVAVIGLFGYQTIRDEAIRRAGDMARTTAEKIAGDFTRQIGSQEQASGLTESQNEIARLPVKKADSSGVPQAKKARRKVRNDDNLKEGEK